MNLGGTVRINRTGICIIIVLCILVTLYMSTDKNLPTTEKDKNVNLISLRKLLIGAIVAAQQGGKEVIAVSKGTDMGVQNKDNTLTGVVTDADYKSHCTMYTGLQKTFPTIKIFSEEHSKCSSVSEFNLNDEVISDAPESVADQYVPATDVTVWIDPLDATQEFTQRLYQYITTMVCIAVNGKPIIGVIHKPFTRQTFWAWVDKTASKYLPQKAKEQTTEHTDHPKIIISRSHKGLITEQLKKAFGDNVKIIEAAGSGYKALEVAIGNATAYIHTTAIKKWDICAGNAILNYLDGRLTTLQNEDINYSNADKVINDKGLIAAIYNHEWYTEKMQAAVKA